MSRAREKLPQIGFWDTDIGRPDHDAICLWVYQNAEAILRAAFGGFSREWRDEDGEYPESDAERDALARARQQTRPAPRIKSRELEPVLERTTGRDYRQIVGYADLLIRLDLPFLRFDRATGSHEIIWHEHERAAVLVEVKSVLPTLGELMRQLNLYRTAHRGPMLVVAPDARYAELLREQGIAFVQSPATLPLGGTG